MADVLVERVKNTETTGIAEKKEIRDVEIAEKKEIRGKEIARMKKADDFAEELRTKEKELAKKSEAVAT